MQKSTFLDLPAAPTIHLLWVHSRYVDTVPSCQMIYAPPPARRRNLHAAQEHPGPYVGRHRKRFQLAARHLYASSWPRRAARSSSPGSPVTRHICQVGLAPARNMTARGLLLCTCDVATGSPAVSAGDLLTILASRLPAPSFGTIIKATFLFFSWKGSRAMDYWQTDEIILATYNGGEGGLGVNW
jgi:hypothetical protein